jgi:integrase
LPANLDPDRRHAVAAYTGMRRNEILALRWSDFDAAGKKLRVERAIEQTKTGISFKPPKTKRGYRTVEIDDQLIGILRAAHEKMLRLIAGVPDGVAVDLSLVKLPTDTLMFPSPEALFGNKIDLTQARDPHASTRTFCHRAVRLGFKGFPRRRLLVVLIKDIVDSEDRALVRLFLRLGQRT